jgi:hypothetical protein
MRLKQRNLLLIVGLKKNPKEKSEKQKQVDYKRQTTKRKRKMEESSRTMFRRLFEQKNFSSDQ